ncbi:hypothetical protein AZ66_28430 [Paenibacillus sp. E194]|uniref:hypothetical protein n=1 Tax=Paenibacillus sp. E194 TaxID=1458845 RepID=UPI0005C9ECBC|nr:hypothetical protein [Paenibacillus sp. E194]KJB84845.1 hypothetical protein AZ66_28430 [Paenibacillus sp. E194]
MLEALINGFTAGIIGVVGVLIGGILTYKLGLKAEKSLIRMRIKVEKIQNTQVDLLNMARQMGILSIAMHNYEYKKINHESYCKISNDVQDKMMHYIRSIRVNEFAIKNYKAQIDKLIDEYNAVSDMQYERYINPDCKNKYYDADEITFEAVEERLRKITLVTIDLKDDLSDQIDKDLTT